MLCVTLPPSIYALCSTSTEFMCCMSFFHRVLYGVCPSFNVMLLCPTSTEFYMVYVPLPQSFSCTVVCGYVPLPPICICCVSHFHRLCSTSTESFVLRYVLPVARWFGVISCQCSRKARLFQCTVRVLLHSLPCFVSISLWRRLLPAFSASPGLCCRSFPCLTDHWTELENENVRESVSKKAI